MKYNFLRPAMLVVLMLGAGMVSAQDEEFYEMSLEELLSADIYSVSKKAESIIDAPLSSSIITRDDIINSGATTLEEVFRLVPGVIVREETNGNFDVHLRGLDNVPPGSFSPSTENVSALIMIDGRRVYNSGNGGVFWETLPVALTDIKQIEVIRGPAQALYGPNAATGVINIITAKGNADTKGTEVLGSVSYGTKNTLIANSTFGINASDKLNIRASVSYDHRDRDQDTYYNYVTRTYTSKDGITDYQSSNPLLPISDADEKYQDPDRAKDRLGTNLYANFIPNENVDLAATLSYQNSTAQTIFFESTQTPITERESEAYSLDLRGTVYGFIGQVSYIDGAQNVQVGQPYSWDYSTFDFTLEYDFFKNKESISVRPGFQFQQNIFNDLDQEGNGLYNAERQLLNRAYFLQVDFRPTDNFRLIGAVRTDSYNAPDDNYTSYQVAATYKIAEKNIVRAVASRAYRGSTIAQMYLNLGGESFLYEGNEDIDLQQVDLYEIGFRNTIGDKLQANLEFFYTESQDFSELVAGLSPTFQPVLQYQNFPTVAKQTGATIELVYFASSKLKATGFVTFQRTDLEDAVRRVADLGNPLGFSTETYDGENERTPSAFGGATIQWLPTSKLTVFTNAYFYGENNWVYSDLIALNGLDNVSEVESKMRIDMKVSYKFSGQNAIFLNARNLLNNDADEFGWSDNIGSLYSVGLDFNF